jgi:hypothetical protein
MPASQESWWRGKGDPPRAVDLCTCDKRRSDAVGLGAAPEIAINDRVAVRHAEFDPEQCDRRHRHRRDDEQRD